MSSMDPLTSTPAQQSVGVRFGWGQNASRALSSPGCVMVVVDVLSFGTAVSVAVSRGTAVLPYPVGAENSAELARDRDAVLAAGRRRVTPEHPWSLSPAALLAAPAVPRLMLPSPHGSMIASLAAGPVVAACLRNGSAVGAWLVSAGYGTPERAAVVIAAGEQWADGSLRPAVEDLLGAGAVLAGIRAADAATGSADVRLSAEAQVALAAYSATTRLADTLLACMSGQELIEAGFADDVAAASALDVDDVVPLLVNGAFVPAPPSGG